MVLYTFNGLIVTTGSFHQHLGDLTAVVTGTVGSLARNHQLQVIELEGTSHPAVGGSLRKGNDLEEAKEFFLIKNHHYDNRLFLAALQWPGLAHKSTTERMKDHICLFVIYTILVGLGILRPAWDPYQFSLFHGDFSEMRRWGIGSCGGLLGYAIQWPAEASCTKLWRDLKWLEWTDVYRGISLVHLWLHPLMPFSMCFPHFPEHYSVMVKANCSDFELGCLFAGALGL